jgi:predicted heme/steroid binding protein
MPRISSYPILATPTVNDLLIGTDVENFNDTLNFSIGDIGNLIGQYYVPYVGATGNVDLGIYGMSAAFIEIEGGTAQQFLKADGSLDSTLYTPESRTLTINGVTYDLSENRTWTISLIDTLTTIGTGGPATLEGSVLNIPVYQEQGDYITSITGEASGSGPGAADVTLLNAAVIAKILTGLNITGGTITAADTILQAFGKLQNQVNGLFGGVTYQGTWNAETNTPELQSSVGTKGYYYVVNVPGNTDLNGITSWNLGDWAIFDGTAWSKVDNTDAVISVNGYTGAVELTYADVNAVPTFRTIEINGTSYDLTANRSWVVGDVRTDEVYVNPHFIYSLEWSKITGRPTTLAGYGITDAVIDSRTLTINGTSYDLTADRAWSVGTITSISTIAPLTGGTITSSGSIGITQAGSAMDGYLSSADWNTFNSKQNVFSATAPLYVADDVISISQSGASSNGYLSSADWNTFNNKQDALTNPVTGTGTVYYIPMWTGVTALGNSIISYAAGLMTFNFNNPEGATVLFKNTATTEYSYSVIMNNTTRVTYHSYSDGDVVHSIGDTQVMRVFSGGNTIIGNGITNNGYKLEVDGNTNIIGVLTSSNSPEWDEAYEAKINSAAVTGTITKTLTMYRQDGGTITASWSDYDTAPVSSVFGRTGDVVAEPGDYNTEQVFEVGANLYFTDTRAREAISSSATGLTYTTATGILSLTPGYAIPTTASQGTWDSAYENMIVSAVVTGTTTKTLTLNQQDGGTITATWSDYDTAPVRSVFGRTGDILAELGDYNTDLVLEGTDNLYFTQSRSRESISSIATGITYDPVTGQIRLTSGYSIPTSASQVTWDNAYNNMIVSAAVIGTETKTLTLNQQDGGTITATWTDYDTAPVRSVFGRTGDVVAEAGDYNTEQVIETTNLYFTEERSRASISSAAIGISYDPITGQIRLTSGYSIPTSASQVTWDNAYNNMIVSAAVTGTETKTLTLNQQDGGTITATWTDYDTAPVRSVFGRTGDVVAALGDYETDLVPEGITNLYFTQARARESILLTTTGISGAATYNSGTGVLNIPNYGAALTGYVPYTGATGNVNLGEWGITAGYFQADLTPTQLGGVGRLVWNPADGTLDLGLLGGNVTLQIGQEQVARVVNGSSADFLESEYKAVKIIGAQGQRLQVDLAQANNDPNSKDTLGIVTETILRNQEGFITTSGIVRNIDTTGALQGEVWNDGDTLYLSGTIPGQLTNVKPTAPIHTVIVGFVVYAHQNNGKIYVKVDNGYELEELHDCLPTPYINNGVLYRDTATNLWKSATIPSVLGYTPVNVNRTLTINGYTYDLSANRTWNVGTVKSVELLMPTGFNVSGSPITNIGTFTVDFAPGYGLVTDSDRNTWDTAYNNMIVSAGVSGTITKTLTLTQQDGGTITATWSDYDTAPVQSVFGRQGDVVAEMGDYNTDLVNEATNLYFTESRARGSIALTTTGNSGAATYSTITGILNVPNYTLSGLGGVPATRILTINGTAYDLSANRSWSVGTVTSVDVQVPIGFQVTSVPVTSAGFIDISFMPGFSLPDDARQAQWDTAYSLRITSLTTTGTSGAATLSGNVLNIPVYQAQGNYITSLTGEATATGPGAAAVTLSNSAVISKVLTGFNVLGGSVTSSDTILTAFGKLQGQVEALVGGLQYQGTWDANANVPTLTSGVGVDGYFYIVSVAGTTNLDGITEWNVGDWAVFHDTGWQKVDNTESVTSVNGLIGAVSLTTTNIPEGTKLYYTDTRARLALSLTTTGNSGAATYNNSTGVFNVPQYTLAGLGGVPDTRTLTINGTSYDLSANRSWSVGTVTSITAGTGLTGGTITSSGTLAFDTTFGDSRYLLLTGGAMTGNISFTDDAEGIVWARNTDGGYIKFFNTGDGDPNSRLEFNTSDNNNEYFRWTHSPSGGSLYELMRLVGNAAGESILSVSGGIGINVLNLNPSAALQVDSRSKGFLLPRMTEGERMAIVAPADSLIVYQEDGVVGLYIFSGGTWKSLTMTTI